MKFATKPTRHCPTHLRLVACWTLKIEFFADVKENTKIVF